MTDTPRTDELDAKLISHRSFNDYDNMRAHARTLERDLAAAQEQLRVAREALFPEPTKNADGSWTCAHAHLNLDGALYDLKRLKADSVCIKTIERVVGQLEQASVALKGKP